MTVNDYPEFVEGQTLTAPELNELTTNLRHRDTVVARMVGFGINAGLGGSMSGSTLTIAPGLAIDQNGEPLFLETAASANFPATPATTAYPFIDGTAEGYSAVLEGYEDPAVAPACSETDCAGHAKVHTSKVRVTIVKGKITGSWLNFAGDELLTQTPLEVSLTSNTSSTGKALAQAIAKRLRNGTGPDLVPEASIAVLDSFSIEPGDIPGAKGYKAGWVNMVLFAALDLLRARALFGLDACTLRARPAWCSVGSTTSPACGSLTAPSDTLGSRRAGSRRRSSGAPARTHTSCTRTNWLGCSTATRRRYRHQRRAPEGSRRWSSSAPRATCS